MSVRPKINGIGAMSGVVMVGITAAVMFYGLYLLQGRLASALLYWWHRVGPTSLGLLPLSVLLVGVVLYVLLSPGRRRPRVKRALEVVEHAAPLLGLLGTVLGIVASGTGHVKTVHEEQDLIKVAVNLLSALPVCLLSTAWGTLLALPAGVLRLLLFPEDQHDDEGDDDQDPPVEDGVTVAPDLTIGEHDFTSEASQSMVLGGRAQ